jgi:hypothetical protein
MKKKNARIGMNVQIKDGAWAVGGDSPGDIKQIERFDDNGVGVWTTDEHYYTYEEIRKVKGHAYL